MFTILRTHYLSYATFGTMDINGLPFCLTAELPWINNKQNISCIPTGEYKAFLKLSPKRKYFVYELIDVPKRKNVQLHIGNVPLRDSDGCILAGESYAFVDGKVVVADSADAFKEFMALSTKRKNIDIRIVNAYQLI